MSMPSIFGRIDETIDLDVQQYWPDEERDADPEYITIVDGEENDTVLKTPPADIPFPEHIELSQILSQFGKISPGDTVELKDHSGRVSDQLLSGDFLRVNKIMEVIETGEIHLQGLRLRRCDTLAPEFDAIPNELFVLIETTAHKPDSSLTSGQTRVSLEEVTNIRECHFTCVPYEHCSLRPRAIKVPVHIKSRSEIAAYHFSRGPLFCRFVKVVELNQRGPKGISYGGMTRRIRKCESDIHYKTQLPQYPPRSQGSFSSSETPSKKRPRSSSLEEIAPPKETLSDPAKAPQYTFGDVFCGAGGASEGARKAGLRPVFAIDNDELAIDAYRLNHRGVKARVMDAHDLPSQGTRKEFQVDMLHFSVCCQYFAPCHVRDGKDDQANYETFLVVGPTLAKLKPLYATIEETYGLLVIKKHKVTFRKLINEIISNGYNVRYRVVDLATYGLPQRRRRLLFNIAKVGHPIPPFPVPTHGPSGSGLKRFRTVEDALSTVGRSRNDPWHQPHLMKRLDRKPYDPHTSQIRCITTDGGGHCHYSGKRGNTVRENASFQGFPPGYHFTGPQTNGNKQVGNAYPPIAGERQYLTNAQTHEAFQIGLINADEDIEDLWETLAEKGIYIPEQPERSTRGLMGGGPIHSSNGHDTFRYLNRLEKNMALPSYVPEPLFTRNIFVEPIRGRNRDRSVRPTLGLLEGASEGRRVRRRLERGRSLDLELVRASESGDYVELD